MSSGSVSYFQKNLDNGAVRMDLLSHDTARQLGAVKHIVAFMITGKDMTTHFSEVANLMSSPNLELKKLVYLYVMQYARSQPERAVLQAGTMVHDANHTSPIIRGIALRTMSSLLLPAMVDFLHKPITSRLRDSDPYVRRVAAFAVLKMYSIAPNLCMSAGLVAAVDELLSSPVASVAAAAACVIAEIIQSPEAPASLSTSLASRALPFLAGLAECGEWSQLYLLEAVAMLFQQRGPVVTLQEAETVALGAMQMLQSSNAAVALAAAKIIILFHAQFQAVVSGATLKRLLSRLVPTFVSLTTTTKSEIRFVALRSLRLLLQGGQVFTDAFAPHLAVFFVRFQDPPYIKHEKIDALLLLSRPENCSQVLAELAEYTAEPDTELARRALRSIGMLAIRVEAAAQACVEQLTTLMALRVPHLAQEAAVVVQTVLRRYPKGFEVLIQPLCELVAILEDAPSKAALCWVVGEFAESIASAPELLAYFFETFADESSMVQLAVLTAAAKLFLKGGGAAPPAASQATLERVLSLCQASETPDLRDRALFFWRLIKCDPDSARRVILGDRAGISGDVGLDKGLLVAFWARLGCLSAVLHRPAAALLGEGVRVREVRYEQVDDAAQQPQPQPQPSQQQQQSAVPSDAAAAAPHPSAEAQWTQVLDAKSSGKGLTVHVGWSSGSRGPQMRCRFLLDPTATSASVARLTTLQINTNVLCLGLTQELPQTDLRAGEVVTLALNVGPNNTARPVTELQVAIKVDPIGVLFFIAPPLPLQFALMPATGQDATRFAQLYEAAAAAWSLPTDQPFRTTSAKQNPNSLRLASLQLVHRTERGDTATLYLQSTTVAGQRLYAAVSIQGGTNLVAAEVRTEHTQLAPLFGEHVLSHFIV